MQHDELNWQIFRKSCNFVAKSQTAIFCRNENNVTRVCEQSSCPLANSRYATIHEHDGVFYLYMKTIERSEFPKSLWERVKLPVNYKAALDTINKNLLYWPKLLTHKVKQRLTKMDQMRMRRKKLTLKTREKIMPVPTKEKKREARREEKAEKAAVVEKSIEKEILNRLTQGVYNRVYNYPVTEFIKVMDMLEVETESEKEYEVEYVEGYPDMENDMADDIEDFGGLNYNDAFQHKKVEQRKPVSVKRCRKDEHAATSKKKELKRDSSRMVEKDEPSAKSRKKAKVLVEVEYEGPSGRRKAAL